MPLPAFAIRAPDSEIVAAIERRIDGKTKPFGALGRLETLARRIALVQQSLAPRIERPQLFVFAADHGAAHAGISAYPQDVTWQMVENFLAGGAAINVFARQFGWQLAVVDAGVNHHFGPREGLIDAAVGAGTANYLDAPAMAADQLEAAIAHGARLVRAAADAGSNLIACGEMGIGNTASASLLTHCLTGIPLDACVGRGTGLNDAGLVRKHKLLGLAMHRYTVHGGGIGEAADPERVLREFGGFEVAMMVGALLAAAERRCLLLIDGFIVTAALLVAARLHPEVVEYCVFAHRSGEPGHQVQIEALGGEALLDLGLRLGEGTGAALALPLLQAAVAFFNDMASFESAGVAGKL